MIKRNCTATLITLLSALPSFAFAVTTEGFPSVLSNASGATSPQTPGFYGAFENVVGWIFVFAIVFGSLMFIVAGILYVTAGGDQLKKVKASKLVMSIMIGVAVAALAWALVNAVGNYFVDERFIGPNAL